MQYSLLVFEIVFYNTCNITGTVYEGVGEWEGVGSGGGGRQVESGFSLPLGHRQWCCVLSVGDRDVHNPQDRSRQILAAV